MASPTIVLESGESPAMALGQAGMLTNSCKGIADLLGVSPQAVSSTLV